MGKWFWMMKSWVIWTFGRWENGWKMFSWIGILFLLWYHCIVNGDPMFCLGIFLWIRNGVFCFCSKLINWLIIKLISWSCWILFFFGKWMSDENLCLELIEMLILVSNGMLICGNNDFQWWKFWLFRCLEGGKMGGKCFHGVVFFFLLWFHYNIK